MATKSHEVLKILTVHHQKTLPGMVKEIEICHASNIKDHLKTLHKVIQALVAHTLLKELESADPAAQTVVGGAITPDVAKTLAGQGINTAPNMVPRPTHNVIVGTELPIPGDVNLGQGGFIEPDTDPEPSHQIQVSTRKDGTTVVIPPLGSKAPKKVFQAGMTVDATYISQYDNPPSE